MSVELKFTNHIIPPTPHQREKSPSVEHFQSTPFKFALQKDGELTAISLATLGSATKSDVTLLLQNAGRQLYTVIGEDIGVTLARNKAICQLVANGAVDAGIVGLDQVYESGLREDLVIARELREAGEWSIVLATSKETQFRTISDILVVATQYPVIAEAFFASINHNPTIIRTQGSTEVMPLLRYGGRNIDGIVDLSVSGNTLEANDMEAWEPSITTVFPVLVTNPEVLSNPNKREYLEKFIQG